MRIVVAGMIAGVPGHGGATWAVLQYVLGFRRLGHDVTFVESVDALDRSAPYFRRVVQRFDLDAMLVERSTGRRLDLTRAGVAGAEILLDISGTVGDESLVPAERTVFLDLDPGFTQLWYVADGIDPGFGSHDVFVTVGRTIGGSTCSVPTCGRTWLTIPQPIVLDEWTVAGRCELDAATSIGNWRSYGSILHGGVRYGQRAHSVRDLLALPGLAPVPVVLALAIDPDEHEDRARLDAHGWTLADPRVVAGTPDAYQAFVRGSWAELGIAKHGYVQSRCGWFSDRSVCYLASGRPVVAQETGFSDWLPSGAGLHAFTTAAEAAAALDLIGGDYARERHAARALAEDVFDSNKVLTELLECL